MTQLGKLAIIIDWLHTGVLIFCRLPENLCVPLLSTELAIIFLNIKFEIKADTFNDRQLECPLLSVDVEYYDLTLTSLARKQSCVVALSLHSCTVAFL